ncbi:MAG: hypothetical protein GY822_13690 [Deltaproteobacteria bacterium]|nr:hypothetical protein [Deltaproteobacteria bacterium]
MTLAKGLRSRIPKAFGAVKELGLQWAFFRVRYALKQKTGYFQRNILPGSWEQQHEDNLHGVNVDALLAGRKRGDISFLFSPNDRKNASQFLEIIDSKRSSIETADAILAGVFPFFANGVVRAGFPPRWHQTPEGGESFDKESHWSRVNELGDVDVKQVWELSRFSWVFPLVRAYWLSGDEKYADAFWKLFDDWLLENPPERGVHWRCSQEASLRIIAICFGFFGFLDAKCTTPNRLAQLFSLAAYTAERVDQNLEYALFQRNNHATSEAAGLFTIGTLFPELSGASRWRSRGKKVLSELAETLIYDDGSFSQYSNNYHRLMLQTYLWCFRLGEVHQNDFSNRVQERVQRSSAFLYLQQDKYSGQLPNVGQNDGALLFPLTSCTARDFRPTLAAAHYCFFRTRIFEAGCADEMAWWFYGSKFLQSPGAVRRRTSLRAEVGGHHTLHSKEGLAYFRCGSHRDRASQCDMLHVDLWWRGHNVALDPGTFSYNASPPWDNPLGRTWAHNTVSVAGQDQAERISRFIWAPRVEAKLFSRQKGLHYSLLGGVHNGFQRLPSKTTHRRVLLKLPDEVWIILDDVESVKAVSSEVHWQLPATENAKFQDGRVVLSFSAREQYEVQLGSSSDETLWRSSSGNENAAVGWRATGYQKRVPSLSICGAKSATRDSRFWACFAPFSLRVLVRLEKNTLSVSTSLWEVKMHLAHPFSTKPLVQEVDILYRSRS